MLNELERLLVQLYTTSERARHVVARAGISAEAIDFDGPMREVWNRIVIEAHHQTRAAELAGIASTDYPQRQDLQEIHGALKWAARKREESIAVGLPSRDLRPDMDTLNRIERAVTRLDAIVRGNPELGVDEGLMQGRKKTDAKIDTLIDDVAGLKTVVAGLKVDVAELKKNQQTGRRLSYWHMGITLVLALSVGLTLWALWGTG